MLSIAQKSTLDIFKCDQCGEYRINQAKNTTGYGVNKDGGKICFKCCGENDERRLLALPIGGKTYMYLSKEKDCHVLTNWPGTFRHYIHYVRKGCHNIARFRYDFWFTRHGKHFHGVQYGDNTQVAHIRRVSKI